MSKVRQVPNSGSKILKNALVGGVGDIKSLSTLSPPPQDHVALVLYMPRHMIDGMTPVHIQEDLGLPWMVEGEVEGAWFDDLMQSPANKE